MKAVVKLRPADDWSGDMMFEIPAELLLEAGWAPDELVEIVPRERIVSGNHIENVILIRKVRQ